MFNYTNTILLNTNLDSSGKAKWTSQAEVAADPEESIEAVEGSFDVKRFMKFMKSNVASIYKRKAVDPTLGKTTLTVTNQGEGSYRLALYVRLEGCQNSYYSNDFVFKGKPLYYEFPVKTGETSAQIAAKVAKLAKHLQTLFNDYKSMEVTANGNNLVLTAADEFLRFTRVEVQKFNPDAGINGGAFETFITATTATDPDYDGTNVIVQGTLGFGTYYQITKDLRLPTMEARRYKALNEEELPIPGSKYNQYTVKYVKNRGQVGGGACVGQDVTSITTHVFFVNTTISDAFEAGLANVGTIEEITKGRP